jgi:hypothetical protein
LPKALINEQAVKNDLTLRSIRSGQQFQIWSETAHHLIAPREYIKPSLYKDLKFKIVDLTAGLSFPTIQQPQTDIHWRNDIQANASASLTHNGLLVLACGVPWNATLL